jgi:glycosyltransferase involved in cell wall biosynthesis
MATTVPSTLTAFLTPYADHFRGKGWRVDALSQDTTEAAGLSEHFDSLFGVRWSRNPLVASNFGETAKIRRIVREGEYDIVHVHTPVAAFITRFALRGLRSKLNVRVVYTAHGFHFHGGGRAFPNFAYRSLERAAGRWTDRLIVINEEDFDAAQKYRIVEERCLRYMPGIGLDFSRYDKNRVTQDEIAGVRNELGLDDEDILYTMIAEFAPGKRHGDAIEALMLTGRPNIHMAFAGDGKLSGEMKTLARDLGLTRRIHFLGIRNDIPRLLLASRAVVSTSEREGLPRSLMESACLGVPIRGAAARGVRDIVNPGRGLLYPVGDIFALRDALLRCAADPLPPIDPDPAWRIENLISLHEELYEELMQSTTPLTKKSFIEDNRHGYE